MIAKAASAAAPPAAFSSAGAGGGSFLRGCRKRLLLVSRQLTIKYREGGLLRRLGARSRCFCCLDPIPPTEGGGREIAMHGLGLLEWSRRPRGRLRVVTDGRRCGGRRDSAGVGRARRRHRIVALRTAKYFCGSRAGDHGADFEHQGCTPVLARCSREPRKFEERRNAGQPQAS